MAEGRCLLEPVGRVTEPEKKAWPRGSLQVVLGDGEPREESAGPLWGRTQVLLSGVVYGKSA